MPKFKKEKDNQGFPRGCYNKDDVTGLEVQQFPDRMAFLIMLHSQEHRHCIISAVAYGQLIADIKIYRTMKLPSSRDQQLRGYMGELTIGSKPYDVTFTLFSDAYYHPDSDNRIFAPSVQSFILVPKNRQCRMES